MQLTCPACNVTGSIEAFTRDESASELIFLAGSLPPPLWKALLAYIGLFRTSRKLPFEKVLKIARDALALTSDWVALEQAMLSSVDAIRAKGGAALKNQNYLKEVLKTQTAAAPSVLAVDGLGFPEGRELTSCRSKAAQAIAALGMWGEGDWLRLGIAVGLSACVARNLAKTPAADIITLNGDTWYQALRSSLKEEAIDAPRLRTAFELLLPTLAEWPQPKQLLEQLPKRPQRAAIRHELNDEDFERGARMAKQLKAKLAAGR